MDVNCEIRTERYKWHWLGHTRVTGYVRMEGTFVSDGDFAIEVSSQTGSFEEFKNFCGHLNGQFSILVEKENEVWIKCSHTWSYPIFYRLSPAGIWLSDDPGEILPFIPEKEIRMEIKSYFLNFGVTPVSETLVQGLHQVRPGELIRISKKDNTLRESIIPHFSGGRISPESETGTNSVIHQVFEKYSGFLKGKKVIVPLTGGYDSRLVACMLKESGHGQVTCVTWGRSGNAEKDTAGNVARALGFNHLFIPTDDKLTAGFWNENEFHDYLAWSGHLSSMPYLQDYFAIKYLKETGIIDQDTVVLPGHPGDFLRGSHLYHALPGQNTGKIIDNIMCNFGTSLPLSMAERDSIRETIAAAYFAGNMPSGKGQEYENWDYEERQCKFIGNSSQVYNFFGITHMMPLFDKELLDYFLGLPFEQRLGASLYNKTLENLIFKPNGCDFDLKPAMVEMKQGKKWKYFLLKMLPTFIREWYYPMKDDAFYREITGELVKSDPWHHYRKPLRSHYFNGFLTQWYFNQVSARLGST